MRLHLGDLASAIRGELPGAVLTEALLRVGWTIVTIVAIILASALIVRIATRLINRMAAEKEDDQRKLFKDARRLKTLKTILISVVKYGVYFVAVVMILGELGINTAGLLAGAGIAGLALGFGAQNLVRDVITGFFILFEDQYAVGDYVDIGDISGIVEEIGLRVTKVRDFGGQLHIIPNGSVNRVTNYRGEGMRVLFDVQVAYATDVDRAIDILQKAFDENKDRIGSIVDGPRVLGVQSLGESGVSLRIWARAQPMEQWRIARELNRLVKKTLDQNGIEIPFPHRKLILAREQDIAADKPQDII